MNYMSRAGSIEAFSFLSTNSDQLYNRQASEQCRFLLPDVYMSVCVHSLSHLWAFSKTEMIQACLPQLPFLFWTLLRRTTNVAGAAKVCFSSCAPQAEGGPLWCNLAVSWMQCASQILFWLQCLHMLFIIVLICHIVTFSALWTLEQRA